MRVHGVIAITIAAIAVLAALPAGAVGNGGNFGVGVGRHYGGVGIWLSRPVASVFAGTLGFGYAGDDHAGWEVGVQAATPRLANRWILRGTIQYGTQSLISVYENGRFVGKQLYEGTGAGGGLAIRAGERQWFVLDAWWPVTDSLGPEIVTVGPAMHLSFGFVVGRM